MNALRIALAAALVVPLAGCGGSKKAPGYEAEDGFKIVPPPGWVLRAKEGGPPQASKAPLPLPPVAGSEKLLVRYDRVKSGDQAWLRASVLESTKSLKDTLATRSPGSGWKREAEAETLEVAGLPAARLAFRGRWLGQEFLSETLAVQKGDRVYLISSSFPAADTDAREATRQSALAASIP